MTTTVHDFNATSLDGNDVDLADYQGQVVLIVNTASQCGFTPQYAGLQQLHDDYGDQGFSVLGFPCDQFGNQEFDTDGEIAAFCEKNYGVGFPMFSKIDVNGDDTHRSTSTSSTRSPARSARTSDGTSPSSWSAATVR